MAYLEWRCPMMLFFAVMPWMPLWAGETMAQTPRVDREAEDPMATSPGFKTQSDPVSGGDKKPKVSKKRREK